MTSYKLVNSSAREYDRFPRNYNILYRDNRDGDGDGVGVALACESNSKFAMWGARKAHDSDWIFFFALRFDSRGLWGPSHRGRMD